MTNQLIEIQEQYQQQLPLKLCETRIVHHMFMFKGKFSDILWIFLILLC